MDSEYDADNYDLSSKWTFNSIEWILPEELTSEERAQAAFNSIEWIREGERIG